MQRDSHPRRVLVVGWGFLGAATGTRLFDEGVDVVGLTRSDSPRTQAARVRGIEITIGDATDRDVVEELMEGVGDVVVAAGGLAPPAASVRPHGDLVARLSPLLSVLECLRRGAGVGITCLSSGGAVYGNPERLPVRESDPLRPVSPYGASCLAAEVYARMYGRTHGLRVGIIRCSNVYGPGQALDRNQGAVGVFLDRLSTGLPLRIFGDGSAVRDYVYIDDVAYGVSQVITRRLDVGTVNLGSGRGHPILELVDLASLIVGARPELEFLPARRHDVDSIILDVSKLRSLIDWEPLEIGDGMRRTWRGQRALDSGSERDSPTVLRLRTDDPRPERGVGLS